MILKVIWQYMEPDPQISSLILKYQRSFLGMNHVRVLAYAVTTESISREPIGRDVTSRQTFKVC